MCTVFPLSKIHMHLAHINLVSNSKKRMRFFFKVVWLLFYLLKCREIGNQTSMNTKFQFLIRQVVESLRSYHNTKKS